MLCRDLVWLDILVLGWDKCPAVSGLQMRVKTALIVSHFISLFILPLWDLTLLWGFFLDIVMSSGILVLFSGSDVPSTQTLIKTNSQFILSIRDP